MSERIQLFILSFLFILLIPSCKKDSETYTVSGTVTNDYSIPVREVMVFSSDGDTAYTDENGNWSLSGLEGSVVLKAGKENHSIDPAEISVNAADQDVKFKANRVATDQEIAVLKWFENLQLENGLLESTNDGGIVSLYDNALAAMVFMIHKDFQRAEKIFGFFDDRIDSELLKGKGGFSQFRDPQGIPGKHRWLGDNAWMLIALNNYKSLTGSSQFDRLADELENWIRSLQDSDGGIWGGYAADGSRIHKITEGNIDAFNAVPGYGDFHRNLLDYLEKERWDETDKNLISWPSNPQYFYAMDLHPWGYCIFEDFPESALTSADRYLTTQTATATGEVVTGYCFDEDQDVVWPEGTGQMAVAFNTAGRFEEANYYLNEKEKAMVESTPPGAMGIPYATNQGTSYGAGALWDGADINPAISSGAWYIFARRNFDPFAVEREKGIAGEDKFWRE